MILQAGVGHGTTLRTIVEKIEGVQPIGLDISMIALLKARRQGLHNVAKADILALPLADASIDGIFEVGVAEHLYTEDPFLGDIVDRQGIVESFRELHRVLKPGGKVGFIQPSKHSVLPISRKIEEIRGRWKMGFQEDFGLNDFCQLVSLGGFKDIRFSILQAPDDFPQRIKIGDRVLKAYYAITGQHRKAEMTGALFTVVATKE